MHGLENNRCPRVDFTIALLVASSTLMMPGCHAVYCSSPTVIAHDSPRAFITSYERAVLARQYVAILDGITPDERPHVEPAIFAYRKYRESENRLTGAIASRFGAKVCEPFHKSAIAMVEPTFTGVLLWLSPVRVDTRSLLIKVSEHGAAVLSPDQEELLQLQQVWTSNGTPPSAVACETLMLYRIC